MRAMCVVRGTVLTVSVLTVLTVSVLTVLTVSVLTVSV